MVKDNTFYQYCVYITLCMVIFSLAISFVNALQVFDIEASGSPITNNTSDSVINRLTQNSSGLGLGVGELIGIVIVGGGAGLVIAWATHSTTAIGAFAFSALFWAAYGNMISVVHILIPPSLAGFLLIGTVAMGFVWVAAVIGMFSGSG